MQQTKTAHSSLSRRHQCRTWARSLLETPFQPPVLPPVYTPNQVKLIKRLMRRWLKHQKHVLPNGPTFKQHGYQQLQILLHAHMVYNREGPEKLKHKTFWLVLGDCLNYSSQINLTKWFFFKYLFDANKTSASLSNIRTKMLCHSPGREENWTWFSAAE